MFKTLHSNQPAQAENLINSSHNTLNIETSLNQFSDDSKLSYQDLIDDLAIGCKPKDQWKIGIELEQFSFNTKTKKPVPYDGKHGIHALLIELSNQYQWQIITENGTPVALKKNDMNLTLEPGGQIEFSGSPQATLTEAQEEMALFDQDVNAAAKTCGLSFLRKGLHPDWSRDEIHWMPKGRYKIMRRYMAKKGDHGIDMMIRSCGAQLNLDFSSEQDMIKKFRVTLALQPFITALMANSSHFDGQDTHYQSYRAFVWTDTDPDRCGGLPFVFAKDMSFAKYVDYALDVPMYFILRDDQYIDVTGLCFRDFINGTLPGFEGQFATLTDWQNHISTLFPDVRLKRYLELRCADSHSSEMVLAMTAFWLGALYDEKSLDRLHNLIMSWPIETHAHLSAHTAEFGLTADHDLPFDIMPLLYQVMEIVAEGLEREVHTAEEARMIEPFWDKMLDRD